MNFGLLFGNITGVPPTDVVILGRWNSREFAAKTAIGLGSQRKVFDNSLLNCAAYKTT
jgi:alanine dehydrogenase